MPKVTATAFDQDHIPRPPNRWILYRADKVRELEPLPGQPRRPQSEISKLISQMWAAEPPHVKAEYESRAIQAKIQHARDFPEYQYLPQSKEVRQQRRQEKKEQQIRERVAAKQARSGRTQRQSSTPYTTVPYSHYAAALTYVPPEVRFGPAGPSPPLSAASTPEVEPVPLPSTSTVPQQRSAPSTSQLTIPPPFADRVQRSASHSLPTPPSTSSSSGYSPAAASTPWASPDSWQPVSIAQDLPPATATQNEEDQFPGVNGLHVPTPSAQNDEMINLTIPSLADGNLHPGWAASGTATGAGAPGLSALNFDADNFAGLLTATADPSLFTLPEFEASFLLEQPFGPIEATFGEILPIAPSDAPPIPVPSFMQDGEGLFANFDWSGIVPPVSNFDAGLPMPSAMSASSLYPPPVSAERDLTPSEQCADMLAFFNFEPASRNVSGASISTVQFKEHEQQEQQRRVSLGYITPGAILARHQSESATPSPAPPSSMSMTYTPPAGARRAHERRVAGSWQRSNLPGASS